MAAIARGEAADDERLTGPSPAGGPISVPVATTTVATVSRGATTDNTAPADVAAVLDVVVSVHPPPPLR
jgi:hypothetical protein